MIACSSQAHEDYVKTITEKVHTEEYEVSGKQATSLIMHIIKDIFCMT